MTIRTTTPTRPHDIGNTRLNAEIEGWDMNGALTDFNEIEFALDACIRSGRAIVVEKLSREDGGIARYTAPGRPEVRRLVNGT